MTNSNSRIDLVRGKPLGMHGAGRVVAEYLGKTPTASTISRWCSYGIIGPDGARVVLASIKIGGRLVTTEAAIREFLEAQQAPPTSPPTPDAKASTAELDTLLAKV